MKLTVEEIRALAAQFVPEGCISTPMPFGGGHINDTFLLEHENGIRSCCSASIKTCSLIRLR